MTIAELKKGFSVQEEHNLRLMFVMKSAAIEETLATINAMMEILIV